MPGPKKQCPVPYLQGLLSGAQAAWLIYGPRQLRRTPPPRSLHPRPGRAPVRQPTAERRCGQAGRSKCLPADILPPSSPRALTLPVRATTPTSGCELRLHIHISPGMAMPSSHCRWQTSRRRDRLPGDLQRIRAKAKAGAGGKCQAKHHAEGCNGIGTDSDHSVSGDGNSWATFNGFQTLAIKQRQKERQRRAMHGIVKSGSIPPRQIRDRFNLSIVRRFRQRHDFV